MRKALIFLLLFSACAFCLPGAGQTAETGQASSESVILATDHKYSPTEDALAAVREQIVSSYVPEDADTPVLLNRAADTKRRPVTVVKVSDTTLQKKLSARSAIVLDARTGEEIYSHNPDNPGQPASTIKVLTSLLAIEHLQNNTLVPVSGWAASMPRSKVYLQKGRSYYANDLINAVLLASANDASVALAEKVAGSESKFAQLMTQKARELGASKTICKTASGLTAKGQQTTARDLATIFREAMQRQEFAHRAQLLQAKTSYGKILRSHNKALWQIDGALGGKTGYTWAAKQTYVGKFSRDGEEILVAILGSRSMWNDIAKLVEFGFNSKQHLKMASAENNPPAHSDDSAAAQSSLVVLTDNKKVEKL